MGLSATATTTDAAFEGAARPAVSTDLLERLVVAARTRRIHDFFRDFDKLGLVSVISARGRGTRRCAPLTDEDAPRAAASSTRCLRRHYCGGAWLR